MARSIWSGSIAFGLVNIPVKLFTAVSPKAVRFHMIHEVDRGRIKEKRVCELDGKEVPYEDIAKGYELSRGQYVTIDRDELEKLNPKATKSIDIEDFVELKEIDPIFFDATYYLAPARGAAKAYGLLLAALEKMQRVGIARMVLRTKQYLCAIRPHEDMLSLTTMLYADEIVSPRDLGLPRHTQPAARELAMARQLVDSLSGKFDPKKYRDDYRDEVLKLIEKKAQGEEIVAPKESKAPARVVDLMDALKKSLAAGKGGAAKEKRGERRHRAQAARAVRAKPRKTTRRRAPR